MPVNIVDLVKNQFSSDFPNKAAAAMGESETGVINALNSSIPAALTALLQRTTERKTASEVLSLSKTALENPVLGNLTTLFSGGASQSGLVGMTAILFGNKVRDVIIHIAAFSGIKNSSASSIMNLVAPATFAVIGKYATQHNLDASRLSDFLNLQKDHILQSLPTGLNIGSIIGLSEISGIGPSFIDIGREGLKDTMEAANESADMAEENKKNAGWIVPLLFAVIAVGIIWFLMRGCGGQEPVVRRTIINDTNVGIIKAGDTLNNTVILTLPNHARLEVMKGGFEERMVHFLDSSFQNLTEDSLEKTWFDFDQVAFDADSTSINGQGQAQINNVAVILNAFPHAKVKIGAYTDKTGSEANNRKLSQKRAKAIAAALEIAGVSKQVIGAEGYGSKYATYAENAPDSNKVKDRHIAISVRK